MPFSAQRGWEYQRLNFYGFAYRIISAQTQSKQHESGAAVDVFEFAEVCGAATKPKAQF
jgi:hypothetical protein